MSMEEREKLAERVESAHGMSGLEKETGIHFGGTDDEFTISSYKATIVRSVLTNEHAEICEVVLQTNSGTFTPISDVGEALASDDTPVAVRARLPLGALTIKGKPRGNNHHSSVAP